MGQGRENVKTFLEENPDISAAIEISIRESAGLKIDPSLLKDKVSSKAQIVESNEVKDSTEDDNVALAK